MRFLQPSSHPNPATRKCIDRPCKFTSPALCCGTHTSLAAEARKRFGYRTRSDPHSTDRHADSYHAGMPPETCKANFFIKCLAFVCCDACWMFLCVVRGPSLPLSTPALYNTGDTTEGKAACIALMTGGTVTSGNVEQHTSATAKAARVLS